MKKSIWYLFAVILVFSAFSFTADAEGTDYKRYRGFVYTDQGDYIEVKNYKGKKKSVTVPEKIGGKKITFVTLKKATKLKKVYVPSDVVFIRVSQAPELKSITVSPENKKYISSDGLVFNKKKTVLHSVAGGIKNVKISSKVRKIYHQAFVGSSVETVTIGKNVKHIDTYAFYKCRNLRKVVFTNKDTVGKIGISAFEKTGEISFYTMNEKTARELKRKLIKAGKDNFEIYIGNTLRFKNR